MAVEDLMINVYLKRILNKYHIDTKELKFWSTKRVVNLVGLFQNIDGRQLGKMDLIAVENEIRRVPNVKDITFKLKHWQKKNNEWVEIKEE
ncbi:MAG: hypothetical protein AB1765_04560 [Candidatus Hydrogenedentota bacterium]